MGTGGGLFLSLREADPSVKLCNAMDDKEFIDRLRSKMETSTGVAVDLVIDRQDKRHLSIDFTTKTPSIVFGADVLEHPGLARMFSQYAILCINQRREVTELEFLMFLRRN